MLGECRRNVLSNGLRVLGVENPALHSFVCSVYVRMGPRFESLDQVGLSHFVEHMIMQGSQDFPTSNAIARNVEDLGGVVDAGTYPEYVNVVFAAHRKHWPRLMTIASDVLLRPLFDEAEIEQEKLIVAQEVAAHRDKDGRNISASELAYCMLFRDQVYEAGTRGSPAIMDRFDKATVEGRYRRFFTPENMVVCLAGGFNFDEVVDRVRERFEAMEPGGSAPELPVPRGRSSDSARALYRTTEALATAEVLLCHHAYPLDAPRFDAAAGASQLLGGGLSSRLFARVREELGLVYDVGSHLQGYSDAGTLDVFLSVGVENLAEAVGAALEVIGEAAVQGFDTVELERYKESVRCGMDILCDRAGALAGWFGKRELLLGPDGVISPQEYVRRQEALTLDDLREVSTDMLLDGGSALVVTGPFGEEHREALRGLFPAEEVEVVGQPEGG